MSEDRYTVFTGDCLLARGDSAAVAQAAKAAQSAGEPRVLIFDDATGEQVEIDPFTDPPSIAGRTSDPSPERTGRGRPRLGVVAREVTLLPRHWDWLSKQPGGASAALRRLVEETSRGPAEHHRRAREATYKVMTALAGDLPGYEEAVRALFAGEECAFGAAIKMWPANLRDYVATLAARLRSAPTADAIQKG